MPFPFPCRPVIRECSWKKTQIERKKKKNITKTPFKVLRTLRVSHSQLHQLQNHRPIKLQVKYYNQLLFSLAEQEWQFISLFKLNLIPNCNNFQLKYHWYRKNKVVFLTLSKVTGCGNCKRWILTETLCFMPWVIDRNDLLL